MKTPRWRRVPRAAPTQRHSLQWSLWNAFGLGSLSENPHPTALGIWLESHGFHIVWNVLKLIEHNHDHREKKWHAFRHSNHVPVLILRESKASKMNVNQGIQFPCKGQCWRQANHTRIWGFEAQSHHSCRYAGEFPKRCCAHQCMAEHHSASRRRLTRITGLQRWIKRTLQIKETHYQRLSEIVAQYEYIYIYAQNTWPKIRPTPFWAHGFWALGRFGGAAGGIGYGQHEAHQVFGSLWRVSDTAWTNQTVCPDLYQSISNIKPDLI